MKRFLASLVISAAMAPFAWAQDQLASEATVRELLEVTQVRKLLDRTTAQMDAFVDEAIKRSLAGRVPTPEQQAILDDAKARSIAVMQAELQWEKLEPRYIEIYQKSFTNEEISGMLTFYRSSAGQAVINKLPVVMEHTMGLLQDFLQRTAPQIRQIQAEAIGKLNEHP
jgi:uncharacterized protein